MSNEETINVTEENFTVGDIAKWGFIVVKPVGKRSISLYKAKVNFKFM